MSHLNKEELKTYLGEILSQPYILMLFNDNFNTFDWVISCLIDVCGHNYMQAEQCAYLVHNKGKCDVKRGNYSTINGMNIQLKNLGLSTAILKN